MSPGVHLVPEIKNQPDTNIVGLGADYLLDKQTSLYVRGEYWKLEATGVAPTLRHGAAATGVRYVF